MPTAPAPVVVQPTKQFDGTDGLWSSFSLRVGNPPVSLRALVSTLVPETWVVLEAGCGPGSVSNCVDSRGGTFSSKASSSWHSFGNWSIGEEENIDVDQSSGGEVGWDTLGIQAQGVGPLTLDNQTVLALIRKDFWLGNLGLAIRAPAYDNGTHPSFLSALRTKNLIPSLSYGYTAGAYYREKTLGSLTLGGYDASRFTPNDLSINFAAAPNRDLVVGIQSITFSNSDVPAAQLLSGGIQSFVDSTLPQIWLPKDSCDKFEKALGLTWNVAQLRYTISDEQHDINIKKNASVTFQVGATTSGGSSVSITLPYSSFDLELRPPQVGTPIRYFPLRQANRPEQYTLGRTFLQEAFLIVNYEYSNFSISQCDWSSNKPPHVIAIPSKDSVNSGSLNGSSADGSSTTGGATSSPSGIAGPQDHNGLQTSAIAGIAIGALAIAILIPTLIILHIWRRKHRARREAAMPPELEDNQNDKPDYFSLPGKPSRPDSKVPTADTRELDGTEMPSPPVQIESAFAHGEPVEVGELPGCEVPRVELPNSLSSPENPTTPVSPHSRGPSASSQRSWAGDANGAGLSPTSMNRGSIRLSIPMPDMIHRISPTIPESVISTPSPPLDTVSPRHESPSAFQSPKIPYKQLTAGPPSNISSPSQEMDSFLEPPSPPAHTPY